MKIVRIEPIPVLVPLKAGMTTKTALGEHIDSPYVILRVHTDQGIIGLGEATLAPKWSGETSPGCVGAVTTILDPALEGADPRNVSACLSVMDRVLKGNPFTKAAVEMALWDIAGKALGVPVYSLLGGKMRDEVQIKLVVGAFDVSRATALAGEFLDWGVKHLKVKVGLDPEEDIARVKEIRKIAGPRITLGVDGNCGWDLATAKKALRKMEGCDLLFAEQPVGVADVEDLVSLRRSISTPIMADESVFTPNDAWNLTVRRAVDIMGIYPGKNGGISGSMMIAQVARSAGLVCSMGSNLELGIGTAAMLHVAAACQGFAFEVYPGDFIGPLYHEADLITEPLSLGPVTAKIPEGPGLGVQLDESQLSRFRAG